MSKYKEFFENIDSRTSGEELFDKVKSMARFRRRYTKRIASAAAAVLIVMFFPAAVLAYNLGFIDSVRNFFSDKNGVIPDDLNGISVAAYENTFDALDISVSGAVRDDTFTVIFIDILRKDGGIFDTSDYILADSCGNELIMSDGEKCVLKPSVKFLSDRSGYVTSNGMRFGEAARCYLVNDDNTTDNRLTLAYCISGSNDNIFKTFRLDLENLYIETHFGTVGGDFIYLNSKETESFSGSFLCEVDTENISNISDVITVYPDVSASVDVFDPAFAKGPELKRHIFTVKEISVSGITIKIRLEGERSETARYVQTYGADGIGSIILKDGTALPFGNEALPQIVSERRDSDIWYFKGSFVLPQATELSEIAEIVIGETRIPLE